MNFLKKLLCKIHTPTCLYETFDATNFKHRKTITDLFVFNKFLLDVDINDLFATVGKYMYEHKINISISDVQNFADEFIKSDIQFKKICSSYLISSPTISGTDSYSYGSENVLKKLPKRDSKGRFSK